MKFLFPLPLNSMPRCFSFIKGRSYVTQLLDVIWPEDFAKAFDAVPHQRLLRKVYGYMVLN